jgi:hypothetical protein
MRKRNAHPFLAWDHPLPSLTQGEVSKGRGFLLVRVHACHWFIAERSEALPEKTKDPK